MTPRAWASSIEGIELQWPSVPPRWSHSSLTMVERCPLKWALCHATPRDKPGARGYPTLPQLATVEGQIIHGALEDIVRKRATNAGDASSAALVTTLRRMGGLTNVISQQVDAVLDDLQDNPRAAPRLDAYRRRLEQRLGHMRERAQALLASLTTAVDPSPLPMPPQADEQEGSDAHGRRTALREGLHPEVWLSSEQLQLHGKADLIRISNDVCEIIDFKAGEPDNAHADQLRLYALLWAHDADRNPPGRLATHLTVRYPARSVAVDPPSQVELQEASRALARRIESARASLADMPPQPQTSETCRWCAARHLCDEYWSLDNERDTELDLLEPLGHRTWRATDLVTGQDIQLHLPESRDLTGGQRIRVLNASRRPPRDDEQSERVYLSEFSELFTVRPDRGA